MLPVAIILFLWILNWFFSHLLAMTPIHFFQSFSSLFNILLAAMALFIISWLLGE